MKEYRAVGHPPFIQCCSGYRQAASFQQWFANMHYWMNINGQIYGQPGDVSFKWPKVSQGRVLFSFPAATVYGFIFIFILFYLVMKIDVACGLPQMEQKMMNWQAGNYVLNLCEENLKIFCYNTGPPPFYNTTFIMPPTQGKREWRNRKTHFYFILLFS